MKVEIEQPHGTLLDAEGRVVMRFGGWSLGEKEVPDAVATVEYVGGPAAHTRSVYWAYISGADPPVSITLDSEKIENSGSDIVTATVSIPKEAEEEASISLSVAGVEYNRSIVPGGSVSEEITTTAAAGTIIEVWAAGEQVQDARAEIEVVQA